MNYREREYTCRGRTIRLRQPEGVVALRAAEGARSMAPAAATRATGPAVAGLPEADVAAFETAGWSIVPEPAARGAIPSGTKADILIEPSGRMVLATDRLTLQVKSPAGPDADRARLAASGIEVLTPLRFAPGLYQARVVAAGNEDVFDACRRLVNDGVATFAEPDLIGAIGPRSGGR